jgi:hypothetical protein
VGQLRKQKYRLYVGVLDVEVMGYKKPNITVFFVSLKEASAGGNTSSVSDFA